MAENTLKAQQTVEERLQPWIDQGEYLLLVVFAIMAWSAGWVSLLALESGSAILGRYSVSVFAVLVLHTLGFGVWFALIFSLPLLERAKRLLGWLQRTPIPFVLAWAAFAGVVWSMFTYTRWLLFPLMQISVIALFALFNVALLLMRPLPDVPMQRWRRVAIVILGGLIALELALQGLAAARLLPFQNLTGLTTPQGRVYQNAEGFGSGRTNQFGWYYPDFRLEQDERRILLNGDTFVQAIQVPQRAHMGVQLDRLIAESAAPPTEVVAMGNLGYGTTQYLNTIMWSYMWERIAPDEIVLFFHLGNDFQTAFDAPGSFPRVTVDETGRPAIMPDDQSTWHTLAHVVVLGHNPTNPIRTLFSQWMTYTLAADLARALFDLPPLRPTIPMPIASASEANPFGAASFVYEANHPDAQRAFATAEAQIAEYARFMAERGVRVRLVTIPYFPQAFLAAATGTNWATAFGEYDLALPEARLREIAAAHGVSFLGMTDYLRQLPAESLAALYFNGGRGHLTEAGHEIFAQALYACFYGQSDGTPGCVSTAE